VVVYVYQDGTVFEVEFATLSGEAVAIVALEKTQRELLVTGNAGTPRWMANIYAQESFRYRSLNHGAECRL
jgi:hypothetical protein